MRASIIVATLAALPLTFAGSLAATRLAPKDIQTSFFTGQPFTATTPSKIAFRMTFLADGKVTREPVGKSGNKGEGDWTLSREGFCTTWKGAKASCFTVVVAGANRWTIMRGPANVATWSK